MRIAHYPSRGNGRIVAEIGATVQRYSRIPDAERRSYPHRMGEWTRAGHFAAIGIRPGNNCERGEMIPGGVYRIPLGPVTSSLTICVGILMWIFL